MPVSSLQSTTASESVSPGFKSIVESIMMEAAEKCEEIDVKCDEEYRFLRRKEISEQGEIIERADKKRREAVLRDDRVCYTKLVNNSRLAQLKAKNDIYNDILKTVKERVATDTSNRYQGLLQNSLTQAMYMLMEREVYITCRNKDQNIISSTFPSAAHTYEKNTKLRVNIGFSKRSLPDNSSAGGMLVSNKAETITVNCSLDSRVDQVCYLAMPMIVEMLFFGVPLMRDSPKLSLQKALSPSPQEPTMLAQAPSLEEEQSKMLKKSEHSMSPPPKGLLEERLGIGTSKINILGLSKDDDHHSDVDQHSLQGDSEHDQGGASGRRSTTKSAASRSPEPDSDTKRRSTIKSSMSGNPEPDSDTKRRSTARSSMSGSPEPDSDTKRRSTTRSSSPQKRDDTDGQGTSKQ